MNLARTTITLSEGLLHQVKKEAQYQRRSVSSIIEERLRSLLSTPPAASRRRTAAVKGGAR